MIPVIAFETEEYIEKAELINKAIRERYGDKFIKLDEDQKLHIYSLNSMVFRDRAFMHFVCGVLELYGVAQKKGLIASLKLTATMLGLAEEFSDD